MLHFNMIRKYPATVQKLSHNNSHTHKNKAVKTLPNIEKDEVTKVRHEDEK